MTAQIPEFRKTIETLIHNIKSAYAKNNLVESIFSVGQLKNKDLHREELLSQINVEEELTDEEVESDDSNYQIVISLRSRPSERFD